MYYITYKILDTGIIKRIKEDSYYRYHILLSNLRKRKNIYIISSLEIK